MKYIRTKDDVEIVVREFEKELAVRSKDEKYYPNHKINKEFVLNQADTIAELCDGLIVEDKNNSSLWFVMEMGEFKNEKEHLTGWNYNAFIKTDKGLIYVAKMNDKGELELL